MKKILVCLIIILSISCGKAEFIPDPPWMQKIWDSPEEVEKIPHPDYLQPFDTKQTLLFSYARFHGNCESIEMELEREVWLCTRWSWAKEYTKKRYRKAAIFLPPLWLFYPFVKNTEFLEFIQQREFIVSNNHIIKMGENEFIYHHERDKGPRRRRESI